MEPGVQTAGRSKNFASILIGFQRRAFYMVQHVIGRR